jgi:hypothetical protein
MSTDESNATEATRRFIEALVGGRTRWREHIEQVIEALPWWNTLPSSPSKTKFRGKWWKATDYGRHPPAPEFVARMSELLAAAQAERESDRREALAATARLTELMRQAQARRPCEQCLRPASPCEARCLRAIFELLGPPPPECEAEVERLAAWKAEELARNAKNVARWARRLGREDIALAIETGARPDAADSLRRERKDEPR